MAILFNRNSVTQFHLSEKPNTFSQQVGIGDPIIKNLSPDMEEGIYNLAEKIIAAKYCNSARILTFGSHVIENGLSHLLQKFIRNGWLTHLASTGTSIIEDFEISLHGCGFEDSKISLPNGSFACWEELGFYFNLAVLLGGWEGLGMGESIGKYLSSSSIPIPDLHLLENQMHDSSRPRQAAAAADLLGKLQLFNINGTSVTLPLQYRSGSLAAFAYEMKIPYTIHPQFGLDSIYSHTMNSFSAIGRVAERDFLSFVASVNHMEDGVYLSVGSSIASPMIFEKALSMCQNVRIPKNQKITKHRIAVVDLAPSKWDWTNEPPEDRPEYYLRYCKSFSRAKAKSMTYFSMDSRDFFLSLYHKLEYIENKM